MVTPEQATRLLLVRHAPTAATRASIFPADEPLDQSGRGEAAALGAILPERFEGLSSPSRRCRETATAAAVSYDIDPALRACDFGSWSGHALAMLHERDPEDVARWMTDPTATPHGGESLAALSQRVALWLDARSSRPGTAVAITHAEVVKAAVLHALCAPIEAFWRIEVAPLSITEIHAHEGRWSLTRANWRPPDPAL